MFVEVRGIDQLGDLAKKLRRAGRKDLQKELYAALNRATKKPRAEVQRRARQTLPRRGGLAARVATSRLSTRRRRSGVRVIDAGNLSLSAIDAGTVTHPVFGRRSTWVRQSVRPGFFTRPMLRSAPEARREIERALGRIAREIEG